MRRRSLWIALLRPSLSAPPGPFYLAPVRYASTGSTSGEVHPAPAVSRGLKLQAVTAMLIVAARLPLEVSRTNITAARSLAVDSPLVVLFAWAVGLGVFFIGVAWVTVNERRHVRQGKFRKLAAARCRDIHDADALAAVASAVDTGVTDVVVRANGLLLPWLDSCPVDPFLGDGVRLVAPVSGDTDDFTARVLPLYDGASKPGKAVSTPPLAPPLIITRKVEMFQYHETVHNGETRDKAKYEYRQQWSAEEQHFTHPRAGASDFAFSMMTLDTRGLTLGTAHSTGEAALWLRNGADKTTPLTAIDVAPGVVNCLRGDDVTPIRFDESALGSATWQALQRMMKEQRITVNVRRSLGVALADAVGSIANAIEAQVAKLPFFDKRAADLEKQEKAATPSPRAYATGWVHTGPPRDKMHIVEGGYCITTVPPGEDPHVGDIRISYEVVPSGPVTVVGRLSRAKQAPSDLRLRAAKVNQQPYVLSPWTFDDFVQERRRLGATITAEALQLRHEAPNAVPSSARFASRVLLGAVCDTLGKGSDPAASSAIDQVAKEMGIFDTLVMPEWVVEMAESRILELSPVEVVYAARGEEHSANGLFWRCWMYDTSVTWAHRLTAFTLMQAGLAWGAAHPFFYVPSSLLAVGCTSCAVIVWAQTFIAVKLQIMRQSNTPRVDGL